MENETYTLGNEDLNETPSEEISMSNFSTYEANKMLIAQNGKAISKSKLNVIIGDIAVRFRKWVWDNNHKYFMLLCKDRSDYTIFNMLEDNFNMNELKEALKDCIVNRGEAYDIHYEKDTDAYEIWLKIDDEFFAYYLFPYDIGVIEIGGEI